MGLRLRINLVLSFTFILGLVASGVFLHQLLHENAKNGIIRDAELMMASAKAIRGYTVDQVRPHLQRINNNEFLPQSVPAFAAAETFQRIKESYNGYTYKEATLNPTNPRNKATDWEADLIGEFINDQSIDETITIKDTDHGQFLYIARPIKIENTACLSCHSTPAMAPKSMIEKYGLDNGFGWTLDEIVGAQMISIPMDIPIQEAQDAFNMFMLMISGIFIFLFVVLNIMLEKLIIRPITQISFEANEISTNSVTLPEEGEEANKDEIEELIVSFNRMRQSLSSSIRILE
ncbi:DUF3365 domain-containing protein [Pleionea sp. CnH1-48]|uniref:Tll0287-like domain-containing protein n=1 Tax=Pleionea sp. CnH1-48 TaxID=2954494 RepID=UPI00209806D1|nr:DUF3365 domain-containing protein [Pleionea sp. CnH1-48]MCO7226681.1 DUF3365 domain-containing protein [Pleionea sp. CnH1-48]